MAWLLWFSPHNDPCYRMHFSVRNYVTIRGSFPMDLTMYFQIDWNEIWSCLRCNWVYYNSLYSYSCCAFVCKFVTGLIANATCFWWHHQYHLWTCIKECNICLLVFSFRYIKTTVVDSPSAKYLNDVTENNVLEHIDNIASMCLLKCEAKSVFCVIPHFGNFPCVLHQILWIVLVLLFCGDNCFKIMKTWNETSQHTNMTKIWHFLSP